MMTTEDLSILLISGPLAVGKTSVREVLCDRYGFSALQSSTYLKELAATCGIIVDRAALQVLGDSLDLETQYSWIVSDVALPQIQARPSQFLWIVDSVRKAEQVALFREHFGDAITHVHFTCSELILKNRYETRNRQDDSTTYEDAINHPNEISSRGLSGIADRVLDLQDLSSQDAACKVAHWVRPIG
ncbi:hypothetical protein PS664_05444 [Pseudomonas fluorescens]|nr:hypothetical protein PS664_05444 [Pseudomonas fluorescens]